MRRIAIIGAGQSGLLLGLGLLPHGYDVTIVTERDADAVRSGPALSTQVVFGPALSLERELGVAQWDGEAIPVTNVSVTAAAAPGDEKPAIAWSAEFGAPAQGVDQRLKVAAWMDEFRARGGVIDYLRATPEDIDGYTDEFDLVVVAAGRGAQFDALFPLDPAFSPYREPQRAVAVIYLRLPGGEPPEPALTFSMSPAGEVFTVPTLSVDGPGLALGMFGVPGGPLDVWDDVGDAEQHAVLARRLMREQFPWRAAALDTAEAAGPAACLRGGVTPVVRHPVGTLPSGARVLAMGDTAATNDPASGQGANMAAHTARSYRDAIVAHGDRPFDEAFMRGAYARYWSVAQHATRFTNDFLAPPRDHVMATLATAQAVPEVAHRFAGLFENPTDYTGWLTDEAVALHYLSEASARTLAS